MKKANELVEQFKGPGSPLGPMASFIDKVVIDKKKLILTLRPPEQMIGFVNELVPIATAMGDLAKEHQYFEFRISDMKNIKEIITDPNQSPMAAFLEKFCLKILLATHKDLPLKIADYICGKVVYNKEEAEKQIKNIAYGFMAFHHLNLEILLRNPTEELKTIMKEEVKMMAMQFGMMGFGMAQQMGFLDVLKMGGVKTTAYVCVSPLLRFELSILAPTIIETLENLGMMAIGGPGGPNNPF